MLFCVYALSFLAVLGFGCFGHDSDMDYLPDSWIDPHDMRRYDGYNKKMRSSPSTGESDSSESINNGNPTDLDKNLKRFEIFVERFINHILLAANLQNREMQPQTRIMSEIPVLITSEELSRLQELSVNVTADRLIQLDEIFSSIFTNDRGYSFDSLTPFLNPLEQLFFNMSYEKITVIVFIMVSGVVMWMFAVGRELKKILIFLYLIFFLAGLGFNWWKLYQEAVIEQYAEMQRSSLIPDVCVPKKFEFFSYLFSSYSAQEECRKYHSSFRFDPFSKIPPTIVLSETVSGMFVHPLKALGSGLGEFLTGINNAAYGPFKIIFLPFIFIITAIVFVGFVAVCLGIKLNFWTLIGGFSIGGKTVDDSSKHPTIKDEISLRRTIECENDNNYIIIQVGTIRRCITATQNGKPVSAASETGNLSYSSIRRRICPSKILQNIENRGKKLYFTASGDNKSSGSSDISENNIQIHWNNILEKLNSNNKGGGSTVGVLHRRSVICKKKYKW